MAEATGQGTASRTCSHHYDIIVRHRYTSHPLLSALGIRWAAARIPWGMSPSREADKGRDLVKAGLPFRKPSKDGCGLAAMPHAFRTTQRDRHSSVLSTWRKQGRSGLATLQAAFGGRSLSRKPPS